MMMTWQCAAHARCGRHGNDGAKLALVALTQEKRRQIIAGVIAGIGLLAAVSIVVLAAPDEDDPLAEQKASKVYEQGIEKIGGKSAVMGAELNDFLASLFHGARLGYTVGITALVIAAFVYPRRR